MSRRLKMLATLNVLGWLVAVPLLLVALLSPIVGFNGWQDGLLPDDDDGSVTLANAPERRPARDVAPREGERPGEAPAPAAGAPAPVVSPAPGPAVAARREEQAARRARAARRDRVERRRVAVRRRAAARRREARRLASVAAPSPAPAAVNVKAPKPAKPVKVKAPKAVKAHKAPRAVSVHKVKAPKPVKVHKVKPPKPKHHKARPAKSRGKGPKPR